MRRGTQRRLLLTGQFLLVGGLGLAALWNVGSLLFALSDPGWWSLILGFPGLLFWLSSVAVPPLAALASPADGETYRLVYDAPAREAWCDVTARAALRNLAYAAGLAITWARDGEGSGCWLTVPHGWGGVLKRLVDDVFPGGQVEADAPPLPGEGVVILRWQPQPGAPAPVEICHMDGVEGVYYHWRGENTATVALWGSAASTIAQRFARRSDLLPGSGETLRRPCFVGDNPWPTLPAFPASQANPGLAAVSRLERSAPDLRVSASDLVLGQDGKNQPIGFTLPELEGLQSLWILGQAAETMTANLACQAIRAGLPTLFLDGQGTATTLLARELMREVAGGQVLLCDVERPAQARFRLNPLWLPAESETWSRLIPLWLEWLRELGVTPAGLGQAAYRHTRMVVVLTALAAGGQGLTIDPPTLRSALDAPAFLTLMDHTTLPGDPQALLGEETWAWWLAEGRQIPNFDVHLRLKHLRDRLSALLALPEYSVLWRGPYLDPLLALADGHSLIWRLPDPRRRLRAYITSQLLAVTTLLVAWPEQKPLLICLHELGTQHWSSRINAFPQARLVQATGQVTLLRQFPAPTAIVVSRLGREEAGEIAPHLPDVPAADLRRLPARRLLLRRGPHTTTLDMLE